MKILYLDIETAPNKVYVWGLFNQNISLNQIVEPGYTMCFAAKWNDNKTIMFNSIRNGKRQMLQDMWDLLNEADAVVHYNGEKFDIPVLNWEFAQLGMEPPMPYKQIDLYKTVKKSFKATSHKLDFITQQLDIGAKVQHKGMDLWHECMEGNDKSWSIMERYNKQDVRLLPKLYKKLLPWIKNHPNMGLYSDKYISEDHPVCPNCGGTHLVKKGVEHTSTQTYQRYRCQSCKTPLRSRFTEVCPVKKKGILTQVK